MWSCTCRRIGPVFGIALATLFAPQQATGGQARLQWASQMRVAMAYAKKINHPVLLCVWDGWGTSAILDGQRESRLRLAETLKGFVPALIQDRREWSAILQQFRQPDGTSMLFLKPDGSLMGRLFGDNAPSDLEDAVELFTIPKRTALSERTRMVRRRAMLVSSKVLRGDIQTLEKAATSKSDLCDLYASLGDTRRSEGDLFGAATAYERSSQLAGTDRQRFRAYRRLSSCYFRTKRLAMANNALRLAMAQKDIPVGDRMAIHGVMMNMRGRRGS